MMDLNNCDILIIGEEIPGFFNDNTVVFLNEDIKKNAENIYIETVTAYGL